MASIVLLFNCLLLPRGLANIADFLAGECRLLLMLALAVLQSSHNAIAPCPPHSAVPY